MNRNLAKDLIKPQLKNYLQNKGIKTGKPFRCLSRSHEDRNPSMSYDNKRKKVRCFSCKVDWDTFDVIGDEYGLTNDKDKFDKAYEIFNIGISTSHSPAHETKTAYQFDNISSQQQPLNDNAPADQANSAVDQTLFFLQAQANLNDPDCIAYLLKRGISEGTAKKYNLGYLKGWKSPTILSRGANPPATPRIIIPTSQYSYLARDIRDKEVIPESQEAYTKQKEGKVSIFNIDALTKGEPCFVTEGEFTALSFLEIGVNAIALGSTSNTTLFLKQLEILTTCCPLILALDPDSSGKKATIELEEGLKKQNRPHFIFELPSLEFEGVTKDANDLLVEDKEAFKQKVNECIKVLDERLSLDAQGEAEERLEIDEKFEIKKRNFLQTRGAAHRVESLREKRKINEDKKLMSTGFDQLDNLLGGGLYDAFYVIGASPGAGKTTFVIQVADYIASKGGHILYVSLEVSELEIAARSISRRTHEYCKSSGKSAKLAKSTLQILIGANCNDFTPEECEIIYNAEEDYQKYGDNFIIHQGDDETKIAAIETAIKEYKEYTGNVPVVVVDYLQILDPDDGRMNEKQNMDNAVKKLKRISRELKTPVIAISSLNRESYSNPKAGMEAFKESGRIESSCDVLMILKSPGANPTQDEEQRGVVLEILKNRNGKKGSSINFNYYPRVNLFKEG